MTKFEEKPQKNTKTQSNWSPGRDLNLEPLNTKLECYPLLNCAFQHNYQCYNGQWGYIFTTARNAHTAKAHTSYNTKFALVSYE